MNITAGRNFCDVHRSTVTHRTLPTFSLFRRLTKTIHHGRSIKREPNKARVTMNGTPKGRSRTVDRYAPSSRSGRDIALRMTPQNRLPLAPLRIEGSPSVRCFTGSRQPQQVFFSNSNISNGPSYDDATVCDRFELMNVTVVIYRVTGIVCEQVSPPKRRSKFGNRDKGEASKVGGSTMGDLNSAMATDTDESCSTSDHTWPTTTAVVSYRKKTYSSQTSLETFLPSIPISTPSRYSGMEYRFLASWPSEQPVIDESAIARSSVVVARCMKQETYVPGVTMGSNYVHEAIELKVHLSRGTEILRLGTATVVVNGEEEGERMIVIPVQPTESMTKYGKKRPKAKLKKYGYFSKDKSRRYYLDENAAIKVGVRIFPQASVEEKERNENRARNSLKSGELKKMMQQWRDLDISTTEFGTACYESCNRRQQTSVPKPQNIFQNWFSCGVLCAADTSTPAVAPTDDVPTEIHAPDYGELGVHTVVSSVSESTDGSGEDTEESDDSDDDDDEDDTDDDSTTEWVSSSFPTLEEFRRYT